MLVIGIDPGFAITGIALVLDEKGKQSLIHSEGIFTSSKEEFSTRLSLIFDGIKTILNKYQPDHAVLENLFFNTNAKTALLVGQARGVVQLALFQNKIPVTEYTPLQVKMALTGYGRAEKSQIQMMVSQIFKLPKILTPDDIADAAAIALTHCFSRKINSKITSL